VQEAAAGTQEVSRNIAGVSEAAQASGRAANDALGVARELSSQATTLRAATDGCLGTLRAA
jgi:methyl-accepting chemotaxis protein